MKNLGMFFSCRKVTRPVFFAYLAADFMYKSRRTPMSEAGRWGGPLSAFFIDFWRCKHTKCYPMSSERSLVS